MFWVARRLRCRWRRWRSSREKSLVWLSLACWRQPRDEAFRQRLQELGYVERTNIFIEYRFAEGKFDRLPALAEELVRLEVDVIVTAVTQASLAAKHATRTIPIVFAAVSDPLGTGLVASLARPEANVTGTSAMSSDVVGKSLELLREAAPEGLAGRGPLEPGQRDFPSSDVARHAVRCQSAGN